MPLMGLLGGVGEGLAQTGQLMQKDALEARREKRLEEAQMRREERANAEWYNRDAHTFRQTYGAEADPSEGTRNIDNSIEFATKYGAEADKGLGAGHYENELAVNRVRGTEQAKNAANQFSGLLTDPTVGPHQIGPDGQIHRVSKGGAAGDAPAQVATVEWIAEKLTNGDYRAAWEMAQRSKSNPQDLAARLYMARKKEASDGFEDITDEQIMAEVQQAMAMLNQVQTAPSAVRQEAPPEAIEFLRQNPDLKDAFRSKYGFLPEGM